MTDTQLKDLIPQLEDRDDIKYLNLSNNRIKFIGFSALVEALCQLPTIEMVNLQDNSLDDQVFQVLRQHAQKLKGLRYMNLANNRHIKSTFKFKAVISYLRKNKIRLDFKPQNRNTKQQFV